MTERLTVEIDDWKVTLTPAPWGRFQRFWYHAGNLFRHDTCTHMTAEDLRAMLLSEIERAEHDDRNTGTVLRNSVEH